MVYGKASKEVAKLLRGFVWASSGTLLSYFTPESWIYDLIGTFPLIPQCLTKSNHLLKVSEAS